LLINCDDLGYGDLGCYGSTLNATPVLDQLAADGMLFTDFYMASSVCSPSRGALLTGCYPPRIGFGEFEGLPVLFPGHRLGLHPDEITIAAVLSNAGYATKAVGKWHCGDQQAFLPTRHGFDSYYGIPYSNDMGRQVPPPGQPPADPDVPSRLPVVPYPPLPLLLDNDVLEAQPDQVSLTARFVDESIRFIRVHRDQPWFLYLAHIYVHLPLYVPDRFLRDSRNGPYGGAVAAIDWAAGVLLAELARQGLADDTIVIFTSDNGSRGDHGGSNLPLRGRKATTWEGGLRVPCIVRWPGHVAAGSVTTAMATAMDFYPTLAGIAGARLPNDRVIDGRDLRALIEGETEQSPHEAFFYYWMNDLEAVRVGRWKLHLARFGEPVDLLYDLESDPAESVDRFNDRPDVVAGLMRHVERARADLGDARLGVVGSGARSIGVVDEPTTLTVYDPNHPYFISEYDLADRG
jgi:arylsulfatase A-like enzyme